MEQIKILVKNKLSLKRLETEKKKYFYDSIYRMDGILKPSEIYGETLTVGLTLSEVENWNKNLDDITIELVKEEMLKFIENKNYVIGSLQN
jgi:predicted Zn-dependent peptidase